MSKTDLAALNRKISLSHQIRLFLDYDGTLANFAPTPDVILPDVQIIELIERLVRAEKYLPAVISGRMLAHVRKLLPVKGLLLAGTYGIELQLPDGSTSTTVDFTTVRPIIERVLQRWGILVKGLSGYYIEDKGWAAALHARFADPATADEIISAARFEIEQENPGSEFRVLGGDRFIEIAPAAASKANAVRYIMKAFTPPETLAVYIGDDDKDEEAFEEILRWQGIPVRVAAEKVPTHAAYRLKDPAQVQAWLGKLIQL